MNKIDVIILKKNIFNVQNFDTNRIYKLSDFKREFPFIDIHCNEYFVIDKVNLFENGQKVRYGGENWYVLKFDYLIVEKDSSLGGYARTHYVDDYIWDYAGHFFHFKTDEFKSMFINSMDKNDYIIKNKNTYTHKKEKHQ